MPATIPYLNDLTVEEINKITGKYPARDDHRIDIGMILMDWAVTFEVGINHKLRQKLGEDHWRNVSASDHDDVLTPTEIEFMEFKDGSGTAELRSQLIKFIDAVDLSWHLVEEDCSFPFDFEWVPHFMENLVVWDRRYYPELHCQWLDCVRASAKGLANEDPIFVKPEDIKYAAYDHKAAMAEGWVISETDGTNDEGNLRIERLDEMESFVNDRQAWVHVISRARGGSDLHKAALRRIKENNATEWGHIDDVAFGMGINDLTEVTA